MGVRKKSAGLPLWRRVAPVHARGVLSISVVFIALIVAGVSAVKDPMALFKPPAFSGHAGPGDASGTKEPPLTGARDLAPDDPVVRFADTGVGHVLYASTRGDNCRRLLFDNRTGSYYDAPAVFCGPPPEPPAEAEGLNRLTAFRKSFQK